MIYTVENEAIRITISDHGAELQSITEKSDGTEYLWHGDPAFWRYRSPILFPIVGKLVNGQYRTGDKTYELPAHGLGRISDFTLLEQTDNAIKFELTSSAKSLSVYPYQFALRVSYTLKDKQIIVGWSVENIDTQEIYFSIGAHPAFMCPIDPNDTRENCYLEFNRPETLANIEITPDCYLKRTLAAGYAESTILPLRADLFKNGVLVYDSLKSDTISIKSHNNAKVLSVTAKGFPWWGLWSPETGDAPFVCIEPWHGHPDYADFTGEFKDKDANNALAPGKTFAAAYVITIG